MTGTFTAREDWRWRRSLLPPFRTEGGSFLPTIGAHHMLVSCLMKVSLHAAPCAAKRHKIKSLNATVQAREPVPGGISRSVAHGGHQARRPSDSSRDGGPARRQSLRCANYLTLRSPWARSALRVLSMKRLAGSTSIRKDGMHDTVHRNSTARRCVEACYHGGL